MLCSRTKVLASLPGAVYSVAKAVPGFLPGSELWRWFIDNAVALLSGPRMRQLMGTSQWRLLFVMAGVQQRPRH
eukprot:513499-Amphidinium_carterae.1